MTTKRTKRSHRFNLDGQLCEARPIEHIINDGGATPDNPRVRWVLFFVFGEGMDEYVDAQGYCTSLAKAKQGICC